MENVGIENVNEKRTIENVNEKLKIDNVGIETVGGQKRLSPNCEPEKKPAPDF